MKIDNAIYKKLEQLGLSEKESRVYVALLGFGEMVGSGKVITATALHGQFVYTALASLEEVGLVRVATVRGRKKFAANSPLGLAALIERKKVMADEVAQDLLKLSGKEHTQDFQVFQGREAYIANEFAEASGNLHLSALVALSFVLFLLTMVINGAARLMIMATSRKGASS